VANTIEYEVPTWNQIYEMLIEQSEKICKTNYQPDILIAIARGGLVPARILTDLLETPQVATIRIEFYKDIAQPSIQPILKQPLPIQVTGKKILIVDDISDSGQSLKIAKQHLLEKGASETRIATLYAKNATITMPDYVEKITERWIVFPWEIKETLRQILQKQEGKRATNQELAKLVKAGLPKQLTARILKTIQEPRA
jgi:hypoxanthine phosphoribosyltransferase